MASSSSWLGASAPDYAQDGAVGGAALEGATASNWLSGVLGDDGFVEGWPLDRQLTSQPLQSEPAPQTNIDPEAEAYARGEAAGRAAAQAEHAAKSGHYRALRLAFRNLDQAAMDVLASELSETVITLCGKAFADFTPDAENLAKRVEEAAKRLGGGANGSALVLHPDDIELLDEETQAHWQIRSDPQMERGGLRFESADGSIGDGPAEWRRAIALALRG